MTLSRLAQQALAAASAYGGPSQPSQWFGLGLDRDALLTRDPGLTLDASTKRTS
jgi:hypothetical protein